MYSHVFSILVVMLMATCQDPCILIWNCDLDGFFNTLLSK